MTRYTPAEIEARWQEAWEKSSVFQAVRTADKPKYYVLEMFPYPSGRIHKSSLSRKERVAGRANSDAQFLHRGASLVCHPAGARNGRFLVVRMDLRLHCLYSVFSPEEGIGRLGQRRLPRKRKF